MLTQAIPTPPAAGPAAPADPSPAEALLRLARAYQLSQAVVVAARLGIADLLAEGPRGAADLAARTDTDERSLARLLRALAAFGVFREVARDRFALTRLADCLRSDASQSVRALVLMHGSDNFWATWGALTECVRSGRTAFPSVYGVERSFDHYARDPEAAALFDAGMTARSRLAAPAYVAACDLSGARTVVDVGGGQGHLLLAILRAHPHLRGRVYDLPQVVPGAEREVRAAGLAERCEVTAGDMFAGVPAGADVYVLSHVLHDWEDDLALRILRNCRAAMSATARLLVFECVLPEVAEETPRAQLQLLNDLNMLVRTGGRERTEDEFRSLLAAAGLRLVRVTPAGSTASALEAVPER